MTKSSAVFLDRDGVICPDCGPLSGDKVPELYSYSAEAIRHLNDFGLSVFVVSNQASVARGIATEKQIENTHIILKQKLSAKGAIVEKFYFCPHHPHADVPEYRIVCPNRKPEPGMLLQAAAEHDINLSSSVMIGDRMSDIKAGQAAGCKTILLETGCHVNAPITGAEDYANLSPDAVCSDLSEAVKLILKWAKDEA